MADDVDLPDLKGAARVGAELRQVRERLGWKLADVADGLRIRLPYLEAIESGELSLLPGPAYQTGFVRSYAQTLGLDAEEILRRFRAEGLGVSTKAELSFLAPVPDRGVPTGAIVLLGVILLLAGYGLWYRHTEHERRLAAEIPSVPAELAPLALPKIVPPPPAVKPAVPVSITPPPITPPPVTPPMAAPPPAGAGTAPTTTTTTTPAPAASVPPAPVSAAPGTPPPALAAAGQVITATADSWVQVQQPDGTILFSKVLHAGDSWPVPDVAGLTMTAGNAGATIITTNGKPGAPLGGIGTVLRGYALTPPAATPAVPPAPKP
jgi:cytoskeleton protein RodZ